MRALPLPTPYTLTHPSWSAIYGCTADTWGMGSSLPLLSTLRLNDNQLSGESAAQPLAHGMISMAFSSRFSGWRIGNRRLSGGLAQPWRHAYKHDMHDSAHHLMATPVAKECVPGG